MGDYKLWNEGFNSTLYYIYVEIDFNFSKSLGCVINYKFREKHMYKTRKTNIL